MRRWVHDAWALATRPIGTARGGRPGRRKVERGVALLVVLSTLTLVGSVVAELQFDTRVDLQLALNSRDEVQAEYSALSALRMRAMLLKNGRLLDQGIRSLATSFGVDAGMVPPVSQLLELVPIECGLMSAITHPTGGGDRRSGDDDSGLFPGDCAATSKSEHSKISLPALATVRPGEAQQAAMMLLGLFSDPKLERFFSTDSEAGDHADTPQELVGSIVDWVDTDKVQAGSQVGDEDRFYAYLKDPYRAKNAPFDSVAELQLVHGMSDELFNILKDRVTIYNTTAQIELATADEVTIAIGVCSVVTQPGGCAALLSSPLFWTALHQLKTLGGMGLGALTPTTLRLALDTAQVPYDATKLGQVFTDRTSTTWYTIDAEGTVGNAHRHIRAVYQSQEGQYYYYRIE